MKHSKIKGYLVERKIRSLLNKHGWTTIRSGGSFGLVDLVCLWKGKCILIQVKSTRKSIIYTPNIPMDIQGFPLYVVVDFGYGNIRVFKPGSKASREEGTPLNEFLKNIQNSSDKH